MKNPALHAALPHLVDQVREGGFLAHAQPTLVMLSGGGDSVALTAVAAAVCGAESVTALHVNYGLRGEDSEADEHFCRELCRRLGVALEVQRVTLDDDGNLHDRAREARYRLAHEAAERLGCESIAVAHNADDRAETLLYRLAASPGRRALLGMARRRGVIVRPLLDFTREQLRAWCASQSLSWREDKGNLDPRFARTHVREALGLLRRAHPAAIQNILHTVDELGAEADALDAVVDGLLAGAVDAAGLRLNDLAAMPEPLAALTLREFVERAVGEPVPAARRALGRVLAAAAAGGTRVIEIHGARLLIEYAVLNASPGRVEASTSRPEQPEPPTGPAPPASPGPPEPISLPVPGRIDFGAWSVTASNDTEAPRTGASTEQLSLPAPIAQSLIVRSRRPGDRMRPLGMSGHKSLQDLFVDAKLPQKQRDRHPVCCAGDEIIWIPGIAIANVCGPRPADGEAVVWLTADHSLAPTLHG